MQIKTEEDVALLDQKIRQEFGIDVRKYGNQEVLEKLVGLLSFLDYIISWVIRPVLLSLLVFILGFFIVDLVHIEYLIYAIVGLFLFLGIGTFAGLYLLTRQIKADLTGILEYSLEILKNIMNDFKQVGQRFSPGKRQEALSLLFQGVIHLVTLPMLHVLITEKVPLVGSFVSRFIKRVLTMASNKLSFSDDSPSKELSQAENRTILVDDDSGTVSVSSPKLGNILAITFKVIQFPIKLGLGFFLALLFLFLYLIW